MQVFKIQPSDCLQGSLQVPGDKSISHRAVMLAALANGTSYIDGFLPGEDCLATLKAFQAMGVSAEIQAQDKIIIEGVGLYGLKPPTLDLDLGNSGTAMRLMTGILAGQSFSSTLTGDISLRSRPMARILNPLRQMDAKITAAEGDRPPLRISGRESPLQGISYDMPIASAQVKSCILLAGLYAQGEILLKEPAPSRDHTERMLSALGCMVETNGPWIRMQKSVDLRASTIHVPGDLSSAAFFLVGATIASGSNLRLTNVGVNPTRTGVIDILRAMGANITLQNQRILNGEPVADIEISSANLRGITIDPKLVPLAIDEFPAIFIAAACAKGQTILHGAEELRVKESDRLHAMAQGLQSLGIHVEEFPDGLMIEGGNLHGGVIDSKGDHRIAMAFSMAGLVTDDEIVINDCANVATSFPNFVELAYAAGLKITKAGVSQNSSVVATTKY